MGVLQRLQEVLDLRYREREVCNLWLEKKCSLCFLVLVVLMPLEAGCG